MPTGWRSPALAPVYALVISFVVVLIVGTAFGPKAVESTNPSGLGQQQGEQPGEGGPANPVVKVTFAKDEDHKGLEFSQLMSVGIRTNDKQTTKVGDGHIDGSGTVILDSNPSVSPVGSLVCVQLPPGWTAEQPIQLVQGRVTCTREPVGSQAGEQTVLTLTRPKIRVKDAGGDSIPSEFASAAIEVRGARRQDSEPEMPPLVDGRSVPTKPLEGKTVCIKPPDGWMVQMVEAPDVRATREDNGMTCLMDPLAAPLPPETIFTLKKT